MSKRDWKILCAYLNTGLTPPQIEELKKKKPADPESTVYECVDKEHDAYVCQKCGHIENFEADGPAENGWDFCPGCGRRISGVGFYLQLQQGKRYMVCDRRLME